jgi:hypothetical protein
LYLLNLPDQPINMAPVEPSNNAPGGSPISKVSDKVGGKTGIRDDDDISHLEAVLSGEDLKTKGPDHALVDPEVAKYASQRAVEIDEATNKRLKRMIDKRILAVMVGTYFLQALDKGTISFVAIMGIREDLRLVGQQVRTPMRGQIRLIPRSLTRTRNS